MTKRAFITGITGQNGFYLSKLLLKKGYEVHGLARQTTSGRASGVTLHAGDITDPTSLIHILEKVQPDEVYNLAAKGEPGSSFLAPEYTASVDALGPLHLLEGIRSLGMHHHIRFYQASTALLFGLTHGMRQSESTPFYPRSPYATAKLFAHWITVNYREAYNLFACSGMLFTHESPRRSDSYVTRKISKAVANIYLGHQSCLHLGNINAERDWGHARDYVEAQWLMLQHPTPDDYVIATGEQHSVRDFIEHAFAEVDIRIEWDGEGVNEKGIARCTSGQGATVDGKAIVAIDPRFFRPLEPFSLLGDSSKARDVLGWSPKTSFQELVSEMVQADIVKTQILIR